MDDRLVALIVALLASLLVSVVALCVAIVVHELAHVAAGVAFGLRIARVQIGPFELRDYARPRLRLVPSLQAGVVLLPRDRSTGLEPLRWGLVVTSLAGPLVGVGSGLVLLAWLGGVRAAPFSLPDTFAQLSVILGVLNLIPMRAGDVMTDGRRAMALLLRTDESALVITTMLLLGDTLAGTRPRDWDPAVLAAMERWSQRDATARLCLYEAAMDRGDIDAAGAHIDAAVALRADDHTPADAILFNEAAYYAARHRGDAWKGRAFLALARGWTVPDHLRARAESAILHAESRSLEARQRAVAGLAALDRAGRRDETAIREQLEELAHVPRATRGALARRAEA